MTLNTGFEAIRCAVCTLEENGCAPGDPSKRLKACREAEEIVARVDPPFLQIEFDSWD